MIHEVASLHKAFYSLEGESVDDGFHITGAQDYNNAQHDDDYSVLGSGNDTIDNSCDPSLD